MLGSFKDKSSQLVDEYWPKIETKARDLFLHIGDSKLNDGDFVDEVIQRLHTFLPFPVRFALSPKDLKKYIGPRIEIMGIKARQANIDNLLMKDDEELGINREELMIQQQELLFDLHAAQEKMKSGADITKITENLQASKKLVRESLQNKKGNTIQFSPEKSEKLEEDILAKK